MQTNAEPMKVIVKMEGDSPCLFFPESPANRGNMVCWSRVGQHSEANMGYYWTLKNPSEKHEAAVEAAVAEYRHHYSTDLARVRRDTSSMRTKRWARH